MKFTELSIAGAYRITPELLTDERGYFNRLYCAEEFTQAGLISEYVQINHSMSQQEGTLRGFHYQLAPRWETKVLRCMGGGLFDQLLDLRRDSSTFGQTCAVTLDAENHEMVYIPEGVAHAYLTLAPNTVVLYLMSAPYTPGLERGIRWNDPAFRITWPFEPALISEKDRNHPDFNAAYHLPDAV
jgi:dTDP-4-dehydrorhamnose 3,5-epimerase